MSPPAGSCTLRIWMPLLVAFIRNSHFNSKSFGSPPRQMRNVFCVTFFSGVLSPTIAPVSARQNCGSPSQPLSVEPSKIASNPPCSSSTSGSAPRGPPPRPPRP